MLQCCVCRRRLSVVCTESIVAKRCVLDQKLLLIAYTKSYIMRSIGTKTNGLDLCLEVVSRSCQPLRYIRRWISRKPLETKAWFQRTTNRKWHHQQEIIYGLSNGHVTDDWWPQRCCDEAQSAILATAWLLVTFPVVKTRADKMCAYEEMIWSWHRAIDEATVHSETTIDWLIDWAWFYVCPNTI